MLKSKKEILDEVGSMVDMVGTLFDERETIWRKFCNEARKRKETEEKLAKANFKLEKIKRYIATTPLAKGTEAYRIDILEIIKGEEEYE